LSNYVVIAKVSEALRSILWDGFQVDSVISSIISSPQEITFKNPTETARDSANRLSLWLHQVTENEFAKNKPMVRTDDQTLHYPPMALNLYYLVTPFAPSGEPEAEHLLLGKTMEILYDNAIVVLSEDVSGEEVAEELRIVFCRLSLEELTRIWEALREPYRLSVCYLVRITHIDSLRQVEGRRVIERVAGYADKTRKLAGKGP
jgi:hypothetical protein